MGEDSGDRTATGPRPAGDEPTTASEPLLALDHATKSFGAVRALEDVALELYPGETHALVGENGAGKSTVVKILAGVYWPDEGVLRMNGHELVLSSPAVARDAGIAVIYQEPTLFPDLTVAENVFMGRQPLRSARRVDTQDHEPPGSRTTRGPGRPPRPRADR